MSICQIYDLCADTLWLGRYGENGARDIAIDVGRWFADLGTEGTVVLVNWRPGEDDTPYNPNVTMDGSKVVWSPSNVDLAISGRGFAELRYYVGNALAKSKTFRTVIDRTPSEGANPPSAAEDWVERMEDAAVTAQTASETAVDAAETATEGAQAVAEALPAVTQAAQTATSAATTATNAATEAAASEEVASAAANAAQTASEAATAASQTAVGSASTATTKAAQAVEAAGTATTKASEATQAATTATANAQTSTVKAGEATAAAATATSKATEATTAASTASTAASTATGAASTATSAASTATAAKTAAQTAQGAAEAAQTAAETAAASVSASAAQIATNTSDITELKADFLQSLIYDTASGSVATFSDGAHDLPCKSVVAQIVPVQSGSGDPSPDNVRPISGWDAVNVVRCGKNILPFPYDKSGTTTVSGVTWTVNDDGTITASGTATSSSYLWIFGTGASPIPAWIKKFAGQSVTVSAGNGTFLEAGRCSMQMVFYGSPALVIQEGTGTIPSDFSRYTAFACVLFVSPGNTVNTTVMPQIELGSTPTPYEPYTGPTYSVNLPQTVYGGQVDVVSGGGNVTWAFAEYDGSSDEQWHLQSINSYGIANFQNALTPYGVELSGLCNRFAKQTSLIGNTTTEGIYSNGQNVFIRISSDRASTVEELRTWLGDNNVQFAYPIRATTDFTVTSQAVPTLYGSNTVYADSGDVEVEYPADTKLYISRLTEPDSDMIADANIVSGKYFMVGNDLYLATANIANGGTIVPGTNCTKVSLATALNAINS